MSCALMRYALSIAVALASSALADSKPANIRGFVDVYAALNPNRPQNHQNFIPGTGTTAERANEFGLNLAAVEFVRSPQPVGFHLSLVAGTGTDVVHAAEGQKDVYRYVYQASVSYKATDRLTFEAGIYPSHIGFEGFYSKDNWNYTRGWLGEFSPYYQTGIHADYAFNEHWSGQVHLMNGWQIIGENNDAKAIGVKIAYSSGSLSASLNTFDGPELPDDNNDWRHFADLIATYAVTPKWSVGGSFDRGRQQYPNDSAANWLGIGAYSRYAFSDRHAFAVRVEHFDDPDNGITGFNGTLHGATLTYEYRPVANLILKFEGRYDHSTAPVFFKEDTTADSQVLALVGAVVTF